MFGAGEKDVSLWDTRRNNSEEVAGALFEVKGHITIIVTICRDVWLIKMFNIYVKVKRQSSQDCGGKCNLFGCEKNSLPRHLVTSGWKERRRCKNKFRFAMSRSLVQK